MRAIPLTNGGAALVDDEDYDALIRYKWHWIANKTTHDGSVRYASRMTRLPDGRWKRLLMHRVIAASPDHLHVDHINRNPLDNRRVNLRHVTHIENMQNRRVKEKPIAAHAE